MSAIEMTAVDRRIWEEELDEFVPRRIYDAHTHIYRWAHNLDPDKERSAYRKVVQPGWEEATYALADEFDALLLPGRTVHRLAFPYPFPRCDFEATNRFIAEQTAGHGNSGGLMLVHPRVSAEEAERTIDAGKLLGFKPYRFYAPDPVNCRIPEFMPEHLVALADKRGLLIMMHLSRPQACADEYNIKDLLDLCHKYPNAKWCLAHNARSYSSWAIEKAAKHLRGLPNVWYDTSSVCESDSFDALYSGVGVERVMYGSDDIPIGILRGKYIAFGFAWCYLSPTNNSFDLSACEPQMAFTRYEQLRAMKRAARRVGVTPAQNQALFHDTAAALVASVRRAAHGVL
jgi:glutamate-1-semialdehyde 2,1-aminomutase